jgi:hypothetical protein
MTTRYLLAVLVLAALFVNVSCGGKNGRESEHVGGTDAISPTLELTLKSGRLMLRIHNPTAETIELPRPVWPHILMYEIVVRDPAKTRVFPVTPRKMAGSIGMAAPATASIPPGKSSNVALSVTDRSVWDVPAAVDQLVHEDILLQVIIKGGWRSGPAVSKTITSPWLQSSPPHRWLYSEVKQN